MTGPTFHRLLDGACGAEELLACVFGLNPLETAAYFTLLEHPGARMDEIADELDRERSTAHRAVQTLVDRDLATRETVPMPSGGYYHSYEAADPSDVRCRIEERIEAFEQVVQEHLDRFHEELDEAQEPVTAGERAFEPSGPGTAKP